MQDQYDALFTAHLRPGRIYVKCWTGSSGGQKSSFGTPWKESDRKGGKMTVLDTIEKTEIRNLLGKGWLTHDGMWFYHTCREFGMEKANELNKAAINSMAPFEISRMKRVLGIDQKNFESFDELVQFMPAALELTLPDSVFQRFHLAPSAGNRICWKWDHQQCFAYKGMKQIGLIDGYRCGVMYRIECWLEAMGVGYLMNPVIQGCLMHEKGVCEGEIQIFFNSDALAARRNAP
jgi:hypothetical protein